jgi:monomeric sarcosine oxidase
MKAMKGIVVVGAGAFGGWTALELVRRGARVTLVDAWGPGHVRASSGGETRVIRAGYGSRAGYTRMAARALARWRMHDEQFGRGFFRQTGALWLAPAAGDGAAFAAATLATLPSAGVSVEDWPIAEARRRYPQIRFTGVGRVLFEPEAGYLFARRACEHVVERVIAEGGTYRQTAVASPLKLKRGRLDAVSTSDGTLLQAETYVFACGPWLSALFPDEIGTHVTPTRQEVFYFGTPAGDPRFQDTSLPVWIDLARPLVYGIPGNAHRGLKIADDTPGPRFDPTGGDRQATPAGARAARAYVARRFPALARAPLLGAEVCQYEETPDAHFIVDRHPRATNVWIAGGGSGHGFKMGPALGELVASHVLDGVPPVPEFSLARFTPERKSREAKWK